MTTMLEKMVEAITDCGPVGCCTISKWAARDIARAALQVIREPDERMIDAGVSGLAGEDCAGRPLWAKGVPGCFTVMIDAILNEKTS